MPKVVIKNTLWLFSEKIVLMSCGLILSVICARILGSNTFGNYSFLIALIAFIVPLSSFGLNSLLIKEQCGLKKDVNVIYSTAFYIRSAGAIFCTLSVGLIIFLSDLQLEIKIAGIIFTLTYILSGFQVAVFFYQGKQLNKQIASVRMGIISIFLILKLPLLFIYAKLEYLLIAMALETLVLFLAYSFALRNKHVNVSLKYFDTSYALSLIKKSVWLFLSGIAAILYLKIDQIMLMKFMGPTEVGIYAVASKISEVWYFFPEAFMAAVFPVILQKRGSDVVRTLQTCLDFLVITAVVLIFVILAFGDQLITILYGKDYLASIPILKLHIIGCLFVFTRAVVSKWLIMNDFYKYSLVSHGFGALINIVLNIFLIPSHGGMGAALSTVISYAFASFFVFAFLSPARKIFKQQFSAYLLIPTLGYRYWRRN